MIGKLVLAEYILTVARGPLKPPHDHGAIAVIDGRTVKLTPFYTANIPPPMAMFEIETKAAVVDVCFSPEHTYMAVLHQEGIDLYRWQSKGARSLKPSLQSSFGFVELSQPDTGDLVIPLQIAMDERTGIQVLCYISGTWLQSFDVDASTARISPSSTVNAGSISSFVSLDQPLSNTGIVFQDRVGGFHHLLDDHLEPLALRVSTQLPWTTIINPENPVALGLSRNGHLYANARLLVKNCTSFLVTPDHVIFTTTNHLLKFIHRADVEGGCLMVNTKLSTPY
jgi:elongator complex protein 1